jgi:type VI secretion system protein ImpC
MAKSNAASAQAPDTEAGPEAVSLDPGEFESLLQREFRPKSAEMQSAVQTSVQTLAQQALAETQLVSSDAVSTIEAIVAELDRKLSEQLNLIIHHPDFQKLEGTWRGLDYLVNHTESDDSLKIRVMNVSKEEIGKTLKKYKGTAWDQSPLFKKVYEEEYGTPGGAPYGALVGDYEFDNRPSDVEILKGMSHIAAASHSPFITAASPSLVNMDSWTELGNPRDLTKIFQTPDYAAWRSLREQEDSRYLALTMPRFLARMPYGENNPVEGFAFEEETGQGTHADYTWANSAYAMAVNINRSFKKYGWCASIRGVENGGMVEGLPTHTFPTDDGGIDMKCPTEIAITDRREAELSKNGLLSLCHWKNTDYAVFLGGQTVNKPAEYEDADATANANLSARLPYIFASSRFAHYLKCMVRDKIGSLESRDDMQDWLQNWIMQYVTADPNASEETKARFPLSEAEVVVDEVAGNPGYYSAKFYLKPHYQLEGLTVSLRLTSRLPVAAA